MPTFLQRALRRPPTADELQRARALVGEQSGADRVHALVFVTLMGPGVLYHFENQGTERAGTVTLTAHELASRLSYHFWGEPPDTALLAAAADGSLLTEPGLAAQVDRLFADPRTQRTLDAFFEEWLHLRRGEYVPSPRLDALAGSIELDGLAGEMREEVLDLVTWAVDHDLGWHDVLTTTASFARSERLASLYGVPAWDGAGEPPQLPAEQRAGLLTRAGLLATMDGSTNPFRRGAFVRRSLLCQAVPPPPGDLPPDALVPPDPEAGATTREAFAAKVTGRDCASCHALFSPLGYALEGYDGLGRHRSEEHVVSDVGDDLGWSPVDTSVETWIDDQGAIPIADAVDLSWAIADSPDSDWCLSRQYFRYAVRREETEQDACRVETWAARLQAGEALGPWLRQIALEPAFRLRRLED